MPTSAFLEKKGNYRNLLGVADIENRKRGIQLERGQGCQCESAHDIPAALGFRYPALNPCSDCWDEHAPLESFDRVGEPRSKLKAAQRFKQIESTAGLIAAVRRASPVMFSSMYPQPRFLHPILHGTYTSRTVSRCYYIRDLAVAE